MNNFEYPVLVYNYNESIEVQVSYINNNFVFKSDTIENTKFCENVILSYIKNNKLENIWISFFNKNNIELTFDVLLNNSSIFYLKDEQYINDLYLEYKNNYIYINNNIDNFNYEDFDIKLRKFLKINKKNDLKKLINHLNIINYNYDKIFYESRFKYFKNLYLKKTDKFLYIIIPVRKIKLMRENRFFKTVYDCVELMLTEKQLINSKIISYYRKGYTVFELEKFLKFK